MAKQRRTGPNGEIWPDDKTKVCATCGLARGRHWFGLYTGYCPDEKQPSVLPDGTWKSGVPIKTYQPKEPA